MLVALVAVVAVIGVAVTWSPLDTERQDEPVRIGIGTHAQLVAWLSRNTTRGAEVAASADIQPALRRSLPTRVVTVYGRAEQDPAALLVVTPRDSRPVVGAVPLASFAGGAVEVRQVVAGTTWRQLREQLGGTGRRLVADTRLRLTPRAWSVLVAGAVDPRVIGLLSRLVNRHTIDVSAFPREEVERAASAPARAVAITAVDGVLVRAGASQRMRTTLLGRGLPFAPDTVRVVDGPRSPHLRLGFLLPVPEGLVPHRQSPFDQGGLP
jgi:hypothetical protein